MKRLRILFILCAIALAVLPWAADAFHASTHDLATAPGDHNTLGADAVDLLGASTAGGDFNGDGIDDLLLGTFGADATGNAKSAAGEAYVIFGSTSLSGTTDVFSTAPGFTILGADAGDNLGYYGSSVAAGDFNGDGIDDLLLGAPQAEAAGNAKSGAGEAYVVFGSTTISGTRDLAASAPNLTVLGADAGDNLGHVAAGDFNGDGIDDLLLGAYQADAAGDFNGDGIDDLLLGAWLAEATGSTKVDAGEAYVIFGLPTLSGTRNLATSPANLTVVGADSGDNLSGESLAAGDFNGDTVDDLLLSAPNADVGAKSNAGEAYVIFSSSIEGLASVDLSSGGASFTVFGPDSGDALGEHMASGNFNGDGADDLLLGAPFADAAGNAKVDAGEAYVIFGSPASGVTKDLAASAPDLTVLGADAFDNLGTVAAGDFNGDRITDPLIGAPFADATGNAKGDAGEAYVIFGGCASGTADSDRDGLCNPLDPNDDNDGLPDTSDPQSRKP
jgi:hypothetical protein